LNALSTGFFFLFSAVALAGALTAVASTRRSLRGAGLAAVGAGLAGIYLDAGAGFAALVVLVAYLPLAALFAVPGGRARRAEAAPGLAHQAGAVAAGLLLVGLGYAAFRGAFGHGPGPGGTFNTADVGRLFFSRDALALEAVGGLILAALAGGAHFWWGHEW
jgi:NADH:ubiquinone oxidoreductase subunit 6 (subunit J)